MKNLNDIYRYLDFVPDYKIINSKQDAFGVVGTFLVLNAIGYFLTYEETGEPILDDYLFPALKVTLVGLTVASTVLAADFFINHAHDQGA